MKNRKILSVLALICAVSLSGCGSKSSSSAESDTTAAVTTASSVTSSAEESTEAETDAEKTSEEESSEAETAANTVEKVKYKTADKQFTFEVPENLKLDDTGLAADCEYGFIADNKTIIGVSSYYDMHYTAKGFMEGMIPDFEAKFDNVKLEETTVNGQPAAKMTASKEENGLKIDTVYYIVQYGNGDLFMLMYATSPESSYDPVPDVEGLFASIEYKGKELRTEPERFSNKSFKCVIDEKLGVKSRDDYNVTVRYNLVDNIDGYTCSMRISTEKVDDVQAKFDETYNSWSSHKTTKNITKDTAQILGHDAQHIRRTLTVTGVDAVAEYYIFNDGATTIAVTMIYSESMADRFPSDVKSMLDTFELR